MTSDLHEKNRDHPLTKGYLHTKLGVHATFTSRDRPIVFTGQGITHTRARTPMHTHTHSGGITGGQAGAFAPPLFHKPCVDFFIRFGRNQYCYSAILLYLFIMSLHKLETDRPIMTILISVFKAVNALVGY